MTFPTGIGSFRKPGLLRSDKSCEKRENGSAGKLRDKKFPSVPNAVLDRLEEENRVLSEKQNKEQLATLETFEQEWKNVRSCPA